MTATLPDATTTQAPTLVVADWSSRCSACGQAALMRPSHDIIPAVHPLRKPGCGVRFEAVQLDRAAHSRAEAGAREDADQLGLPYVGRQT